MDDRVEILEDRVRRLAAVVKGNRDTLSNISTLLEQLEQSQDELLKSFLELSLQLGGIHLNISRVADHSASELRDLAFRLIQFKNEFEMIKTKINVMVDPTRLDTGQLRLYGLTKKDIVLVKKQMNMVLTEELLDLIAKSLSIDLENIPGDTKRLKIANMVEYAIFRGKFWDLSTELRNEFPNLIWPAKPL